MKFKKEFLKYLIVDANDHAELIKNTILETNSYIEVHEIIFRFNDKFYKSTYNISITNSLLLEPYSGKNDDIECIEVEPVEQIITIYKPANNTER